MTTGRGPKPTALHRLHGTYNATKHGRDRAGEPVAAGELRAPPAGVTAGQRVAWRYAVAHAPKGVLKAIDREILRCWVETLDRRNQAQQILKAEDSAILWSASLCHRIVDRTTALLIRPAGELGFSPAAGPRLGPAPPPPVNPDNPWSGPLRLLSGGKAD